MSGGFYIQPDAYVIGLSSTPATLSASYAGNTDIIHTANKEQLELYIAYTPAENNRVVNIQLLGGPSVDDLYYFANKKFDTSNNEILSIPNIQYTGALAGVTYKIRISEPVADKYVRVSVKEDGSASFGTVSIRFMVSGL